MAGLLVRWTTGIVGALLMLLNAMHLTLGFVCLQRALAAEPIPLRFSDPLKTAWLYLGVLGFFLGWLLVWLLPDLAAGSAGAWKAAVGRCGPVLPLRRRPAVPVAYDGYRSGPGTSLPPLHQGLPRRSRP